MAKSTENWLSATKGFGFSQPEGGETDIFIRKPGVESTGILGLEERQTVTFDALSGRQTVGRNLAII